MKIEGAVPQVMTGHAGDRKGRGKAMDDRPGLPPEQILGKTQEMSPEATAGIAQPPANGVIRNLQEGHFKGVASIRLQMHFYERLELASASQANEAVAAGSQALVAGVEQQVFSIRQEFAGIFAETDATTNIDQLFSSFSETVDNLFADLNSPSTSPGELLSGISEAFSSFFEEFEAMGAFSAEFQETGDTEATDSVAADQPAAEDAALPTSADGQPASSLTDTESGTETADGALPLPTFTDRLGELQFWFDETFAAMAAQVDQLLQPPSFGEPRGNGRAYSRFAAVYQEMYQVTAPGSATAKDNDSGLVTTA